MITLITGLPGAGKTLYALDLVQREYADRPIVHNDIPDLSLPWDVVDGHQWQQVPSGTVVVLDEAQRVFRPQQRVEPHVAALETHRHAGVDLVVITQHPKLVHANVRKLAGRHLHVVRMFGAEVATVHEFSEVCEDPERSRTGSIRHRFAYPKALYGAYKSAEVHTHKRRIPGRVWALAGIPLFAVAAIGSAVLWIKGNYTASELAPAPAPVALQTASLVPQAPSPAQGPQQASAEYIRAHMPAIPGLAYTAPAYAEITRPVAAPAPVACVAAGDRCQCYTEHATRIPDVPQDVCRGIVANGAWFPWRDQWGERPEPSPAANGRTSPPEQPAAVAGR